MSDPPPPPPPGGFEPWGWATPDPVVPDEPPGRGRGPLVAIGVAVAVAALALVVLLITRDDEDTTATDASASTTAELDRPSGADTSPDGSATDGSPAPAGADEGSGDPDGISGTDEGDGQVFPGGSPPPVSLDPNAVVGTRANPNPIGTPAEVAGWRITVAEAGGGAGAVTATVRLEWRGREGQATGDPADLVLRINDANGEDQVLGGPACSGDPTAELADTEPLAEGESVDVELCWTVAGARSVMALVAESVLAAETAYLSVA